MTTYTEGLALRCVLVVCSLVKLCGCVNQRTNRGLLLEFVDNSLTGRGLTFS